MLFSNLFMLIDLSHPLEEGMPAWDNCSSFNISTKLDYSDCEGDYKFCVQKFTAVAGIGTHIDAPKHCFQEGMSVDELSLSSLCASAVIIDVSNHAHETYKISVEDVLDFEEKFGKIASGSLVIIYTGWSSRWSEPERYRNNLIFPSVAPEAAELLLKRNCVGLGIDTLSPDMPSNGFPVHHIFLGAGKYIIENIADAYKLPPVGGICLALPLRIKGATEAPLRLVGLKPK